MLKIKRQLKLKSLKGISLTPNILYDRIGVYYRIMNLQISAEDFLHLLSRPPEIYLSEGEIFHLTVNNDTSNQYLKMEIINQMLNRLLLLENQTLSYQDSIFVSTMLRKTGIKQTGQLLRDIRQSLKEHQTIKKLTDMYRYNGTIIRKLVGAGEKESVSRYALSSAIYQRLQTEEIYNEVYERNRQYGSVMQTINHQELNMAEQVRASGNLLLSRLRKECIFRETEGSELYINPYEAGVSIEKTVTEDRVLSEILSATVLGLVNNICQIRMEQMEQQIYPQFRIVQSFYHSMENVLNRYEFFHTQETWQTEEIYPFMEDNSRLWDSEINLLEDLVRNETVMRLSNETIHSARWQQALIYRLSQNEEYNLSEAVRNVFMEYREKVRDINHQTEQDNRYQIKQYLSLPRKLQLIGQAVKENPAFSDIESEYQNIIGELQNKTDEYFSDEKQESVNEIISEMVCKIVSRTIKDISAQTSDQQNTLIRELLEVREISEVIKEIKRTGYIYGYPRLDVVSESDRLRQKLNLTYSVVHQWFDNEETDIMIRRLRAEGSESDSETVFRRNSNTYIKEKALRELRQLIQKEESIRNSYRQNNEYRQQYHKKTKDIPEQLSEKEEYNGSVENSGTELRKTAEIQKELQNREMFRQLQEINKKNIEINQKYRQEMQQRNTSVSRLQADGRKTIKEALKAIHNPQNNSVESMELIQKNPPMVINEAVRKLASRETIEIFETILGKESGSPGESGDRTSQKRFVDTGEEEKRSIKIHREPEAALQWEIREIEQQMERQTKQQSSVMRTRESIMTPAGTQEKFRAAGDSPGPLQNPLQAVTFIHKEQNNLTEEALLPYLRQYRQSESSGKNSIKETVVNHGTEMKEISRKKNQAESQSKEEVEELIRRNLHRQMETITDRVVNRIEKKLQMERRRRGY